MKRGFLCFCMIFLISCGGGGGSFGRSKDTLIVAMRREPSTLDPHNSTLLANFVVQRVIYDTLIVRDDNGEMIPCLAESWEFIDDLTIRFYLRDDVVFSNGDKMTAEDVRYSLWRATKERGSASLFTGFDGEGMKVIDDYTVDVKMAYPFAPVFNYLASARGNIINKRAMEEMGAEEFARNPVGTGSFIIKDWITADSVVLARNENYWDEKPEYENLIFRIITEPTSRAIELETGGVDMIYDIAVGDAQRLDENPDTKLIRGPGYRFSYITMSPNTVAPFNDIRVREALNISLDMQRIVDIVFQGSAIVADSLMAPSVFGYHKVGPYEYNPERAKQLLKEAGYEDLKITLMTYEDRLYIDITEIAQSMWKEVGIDVEVQIVEQAAFMARAADTVAMSVTGGTPVTGDPDHALLAWPSVRKTGLLKMNDPIIDDFILRGRSTYNETDRKAIYADAMEYMWSQFYVIPISFADAMYATRSNIEGLEAHPGGVPDLSKIKIK